MLIIGLTGGTGCGTTTVGEILAESGFLFINTDKVYHELLVSDASLRDKLEERFGSSIITAEKLVDRRALGKLVFSNSEAMSDLNRITHSAIAARVKSIIDKSGAELVAVEAVELLESPIAPLCSASIGVIADDDVRAYRIMIRDALGRADAYKRIKAQRPNSYYIENCDYVIVNNNSLAELRADTELTLNKIRNTRKENA